MNQSITIFLLVLAIWYTMQPGEIFGKLGFWLGEKLPKKIHPPVFECNVCMTPYYGSALYWLLPWEHSLVWWLPIVIAAMGMQVVLNKLSPKKVNMAKPILVIRMTNRIGSDKHTMISDRLKKDLSDWHILAVVDDGEGVRFEAYSEGKAEPLTDEIRKQLEAVIP